MMARSFGELGVNNVASAIHFEAMPEGETSCVSYEIQRVAVLGAGTMGAQIAAHVANAGLPVVLLDMVSPGGDGNGVARAALEKIKKSIPPALGDSSVIARIRIGNFDDLAVIADCDWVVEAVAEKLEVKQSLLSKVALQLKDNAILTTNTSGLPIETIGTVLPSGVRRRWFGSHFFNPPRYMRLLEIIATPETDPAAVRALAEFGERRLGKTVVAAQDVPNFIANRIGVFSMLNTLAIMEQESLNIEEVDVLTGNMIGWPKTGTFRLTDMVGIDVLYNVAENFVHNAMDERADVTLPAFVEAMVSHGLLGDKTKQGFYKKAIGPNSKETRQVIDLKTFDYRAAETVSLPELEEVAAVKDTAARMRLLMADNASRGKASRFYSRALPELWNYSANRIGEVAASVVEIDRAMRAGFNWELGPFEMWDAAGVGVTVARMREQGLPVAKAVEKLLAAGGDSWYRAEGREYFDPASRSYLPVPVSAVLANVTDYRRSHGVFEQNESVSLVDLGDGIGCFEFHSKMNALDKKTVDFLRKHLRPGSPAVRNFHGFVIANDAQNFCVGANLKELLLNIQGNNWEGIRKSVDDFQEMTRQIKFCPRPVVAAPTGLTLGGGAEVMLHATARQPHFELHAGLVETGVGLLPGGGGCKEMLLRALEAAENVRHDSRGDSTEFADALKTVFETIAMAKVSGSALEARGLRLIGANEQITMHRDRVTGDARSKALELAEEGYLPPLARVDIPAPGRGALANFKINIFMLRDGGFISDHDVKVARHLAFVLCGGDVVPGTLLSEDYFLELEREAFLSLCGEKKTMERIEFTLKAGKPLRN